MRICITCQDPKHEDEFPWVHGLGSTKRKACKPCYNADQRQKRQEKSAIKVVKEEKYKVSESLTILALVARKDTQPKGYYCR